jgi:hypothetical protein
VTHPFRSKTRLSQNAAGYTGDAAPSTAGYATPMVCTSPPR